MNFVKELVRIISEMDPSVRIMMLPTIIISTLFAFTIYVVWQIVLVLAK